ncbi:MAG: sterol desaturase family protein [Burkholderiales bacterium]|jgi:sterol desaturase/sphingolipid hydroxylase (fatty acid hydroxylase superfamily)|nr:sterol desaturase family protein [Burkholderiales bacterium]
MKIDELIALLILVTYFGMLAVEHRHRARTFPPVPHWRSLGLGFLALLFMLNGLIPALLPMEWVAAHALLPGWKLGVAGGAVLGFLGATLLDYAVHRSYHRVHALWCGVHQLHHSPSRVDIYGSAYAHPIEIALMVAQGVFMLVFVLGLDPAAGAIAGYASAFCAMFQHWNIQTPRWLGNFIQRPESHCLHHERDVHAWNYSNLPLWDMLFGTFRNPVMFAGAVGFAAGRGERVAAMLMGTDVHADQVELPYLPV